MEVKDIRIGIIGMGHVGLTTALGLAELDWTVTGADHDEFRMSQLAAGECPFYEPGLQELLTTHLDSQRFIPDPDVERVIRSSSVLFVCVGTPQKENGAADLSQVDGLARSIARNLNGYKLVVEKSTVPVKTAEKIRRTLLQYQEGEHEFDVASNPEFLREGTALQDFLRPDRVVIGVDSDRARALLLELYERLDTTILVTDLSTAEIIKHAANAFLATKISFINMIADLCDATGADVTNVSEGIGLDPRIGREFLKAGIGFGGYCLPKDLQALTHIGEAHGVEFSLLKEVDAINHKRIDAFLGKARCAIPRIEEQVLAVWGLAYKGDTDDVREAPSLHIVRWLLEEGAHLRLYDPKATSNFQEAFAQDLPKAAATGTGERLKYCSSMYDAADGANALLILTDWREFLEADLIRIKRSMATPIIVDGRNLLNPDVVRNSGFRYYSVGRP